MGEPKFKKDRQQERIRVRIPVRIQHKRESGRTYEGEILNLSAGGAYITAETPFEVGTELSLEFRFAEIRKFSSRVVEETEPAAPTEKPDTFPSSTAGVVRWQEEKRTGGFGVEFTPVHSDEREYLQKVIAYFLQLAKAGVTF